MDYYKNTQEDWEYPGFSYLNESLMSAIIDGNVEATAIELSRQKRNETTDDISNHLIARGFWLQQKLRLSSLYESLVPGRDRGEVIDEIRTCIHDLDTRFTGTFISENTEYRYDKLSGDKLFREAVGSSNAVARQIIVIDKDDLRSPQDLLDHVALRHNILIHDLGQAPANLGIGYWGAGTTITNELKRIILSKTDSIDRELIDGLYGAAVRSPL